MRSTRKKAVLAAAALVVLNACAGGPRSDVPQPVASGRARETAAVPLAAMRGAWTGSYRCPQGEQVLNLYVLDGRTGVEGLAEFVPPPWNPRAGTGISTIRGSIDPAKGTAEVRMDEWIMRPPRYIGVAWLGSFQPDGSLVGETASPGCSYFTVRRDAVDPKVFAAIEANPVSYARRHAAAQGTLVGHGRGGRATKE